MGGIPAAESAYSRDITVNRYRHTANAMSTIEEVSCSVLVSRSSSNCTNKISQVAIFLFLFFCFLRCGGMGIKLEEATLVRCVCTFFLKSATGRGGGGMRKQK